MSTGATANKCMCSNRVICRSRERGEYQKTERGDALKPSGGGVETLEKLWGCVGGERGPCLGVRRKRKLGRSCRQMRSDLQGVVLTGYVSGSGTCIYPNPPRGSLELFQTNKSEQNLGNGPREARSTTEETLEAVGGVCTSNADRTPIALSICAASYQHDSIPCSKMEKKNPKSRNIPINGMGVRVGVGMAFFFLNFGKHKGL